MWKSAFQALMSKRARKTACSCPPLPVAQASRTLVTGSSCEGCRTPLLAKARAAQDCYCVLRGKLSEDGSEYWLGASVEMCGRYTLRAKLNLLLDQFAAEMAEPIDYRPRYNIPPTANVLAVRQGENR